MSCWVRTVGSNNSDMADMLHSRFQLMLVMNEYRRKGLGNFVGHTRCRTFLTASLIMAQIYVLHLNFRTQLVFNATALLVWLLRIEGNLWFCRWWWNVICIILEVLNEARCFLHHWTWKVRTRQLKCARRLLSKEF